MLRLQTTTIARRSWLVRHTTAVSPLHPPFAVVTFFHTTAITPTTASRSLLSPRMTQSSNTTLAETRHRYWPTVVAMASTVTAAGLVILGEEKRNPTTTAKTTRTMIYDACVASVATGYTTTAYCAEPPPTPIPVCGLPGTNFERTFLAIKPDGVQRGLIGDIIARFEKRGYKLVGLKMVWPTPELAADHYADLSTKKFFPSLIKFFSSGPIVAMCWEGKDVIKQGRMMLGETQPLASAPGSIRGDYSIDLGRNICHGSDSPESARHELEMWFPEGVNDWTKTVNGWVYE